MKKTQITFFLNDSAASFNAKSILKANEKKFIFKILCFKNSPCSKILKNQVCLVDENTDFKSILKDSDVLFVATSWQNSFYIRLIRLAKKLHIPSVVFMEHWINYKERFLYPKKNWKQNLALFATVNDKFAYKIAKKSGFKNVLKLKFQKLADEYKEFSKLKHKEKNRVLFVSEPTSDVALRLYKDEQYFGFTEFSLLEELCKNLEKLKMRKLTIRLHPSDKKDKYDYVFSKFPNLQIVLENPYEKSLAESLAEHKLIVGIDGFVLYQAYVFGKRVISFIPSKKRKCTVPLPKSNKIKSFKGFSLENLKRERKIKKVLNFGLSFEKIVKKIRKKYENCL